MRLELYSQARENMARIQQENNNLNFYDSDESIDLEKINKQKLDYLFNNKMAKYLYKKEYNQYGGGCTICLAEFNKKSEVSITTCNYVFHYKCIHDWLYQNVKNPKFPNCSHEVLKEEDEFNIKEKEINIIRVRRRQGINLNNINQPYNFNRGLLIQIVEKIINLLLKDKELGTIKFFIKCI